MRILEGPGKQLLTIGVLLWAPTALVCAAWRAFQPQAAVVLNTVLLAPLLYFLVLVAFGWSLIVWSMFTGMQFSAAHILSAMTRNWRGLAGSGLLGCIVLAALVALMFIARPHQFSIGIHPY